MVVMVFVMVLVMALVMVRVMDAGIWGLGDGTGDCGRGGARAGTGTGDAPEPEVSVYSHANILQMVCKMKNSYFLNFIKYHTYEHNQNSLNSEHFCFLVAKGLKPIFSWV